MSENKTPSDEELKAELASAGFESDFDFTAKQSTVDFDNWQMSPDQAVAGQPQAAPGAPPFAPPADSGLHGMGANPFAPPPQQPDLSGVPNPYAATPTTDETPAFLQATPAPPPQPDLAGVPNPYGAMPGADAGATPPPFVPQEQPPAPQPDLAAVPNPYGAMPGADAGATPPPFVPQEQPPAPQPDLAAVPNPYGAMPGADAGATPPPFATQEQPPAPQPDLSGVPNPYGAMPGAEPTMDANPFAAPPAQPDLAPIPNPYGSSPEMSGFTPPPEMPAFSAPPQAEAPSPAVPAYYVNTTEDESLPDDNVNLSTEEATEENVEEAEDDKKAKKTFLPQKQNKYVIAKEAKANGLQGTPDFTKRDINLMTKLITWSSPEKIIPVFAVSMLCIILFSYFGVWVVLQEESQAAAELSRLESQILLLNASLKDYNEIAIEYTVYSEEWMTPTELELVSILDVIPIFEQHFLEIGRVESFTLINNILSATISGISIGDTSALVRDLESERIVESVTVYTATSEDDVVIYNEEGQRVDEEGNLLDEEGYRINEDGEYIDEYGNIIVVEPVLDEDGNEIKEISKGKEAGIVMTVKFIKVEEEIEEEIEESEATTTESVVS